MNIRTKKRFVPGRGYSKSDWDDVSDNPEWTEEELKNARPFAEVFPELHEKMKKARGRPPVEKPRQLVSIRLDPDVISYFKRGGKGWQTRINDMLRKAAGLEKG